MKTFVLIAGIVLPVVGIWYFLPALIHVIKNKGLIEK